MTMASLKQAIYLSGLRQTEVSDLAGISEAMLSRILRGERTPSPRVKARISRVLGVRVRELWPVKRDEAA